MSSAAPQPNTFRPDIDGLRAVAVLLVVAFHARVPGFEIGFVGVDLFLVISGFLITQKLRSEIERTGRLDVVAFLLGRVRRLLPAAFVVVTITLFASLIVFVPFVWPELITDAWASAFYWANLRFGTQSADYFARGLAASPFQHMWSLAVEEQFYVVWPLVMLGTAQRSRRFALMVVAAITLGCFAHAVIDARVPTALTYYHPLSRGWELGAGATLALAWPWVAPVVAHERVALALRIVGFGLLASTLIWWTGGSHYPGIASAGPVFSALLLIGAHGDRSPLAAGLASQPFQHVGRWSYSWYLWHWPVMVIGARALTRWTDVDVGWHHGAVLGIVSLVPAVLSYRYVESPLRHSRVLTRSPTRTIGLAVATSAASLLVIGGAGWWARTTLSEPELLAFADAREDWPDMPSACATSDPDELLALCTTGDREGEHTMVIGDSHAANWVAGIAPAVQSRGGRLTTAIGGSCLLIGDGNVGEPSWCPEMREGMPAAIESLHPDRVIFSQSAVYRQLRGTSADVGTGVVWTEAMVDFLSPLRDAGIEVIVILPTPKHDRHPIDCRAVESDPTTCELSRADAEASVRVFADATRSARAIVDHGTLVDPIHLLCDEVSCPFRNGDQVVWADSHHITTAHARTHEAFFAELLGADGVER